MKKIGLFGGTFDPIHFGHLNLAIQLMEKCDLEEVWFIPTYLNPLKKDKPPVSFADRSEMIRLAIEPIKAFKLMTLEQELPVPSLTINTLEALMASLSPKEKKNHYYLLLGEDVFPGFIDWNSSEKILDLVSLLIGSRRGFWDRKLENFSPKFKEAIKEGSVETKLFEISSTELRERIELKKYVGCFLPTSVENYIKEKGLYCVS